MGVTGKVTDKSEMRHAGRKHSSRKGRHEDDDLLDLALLRRLPLRGDDSGRRRQIATTAEARFLSTIEIIRKTCRVKESVVDLSFLAVLGTLLHFRRPMRLCFKDAVGFHTYTVGLCILGLPEIHVCGLQQDTVTTNALECIIDAMMQNPLLAQRRFVAGVGCRVLQDTFCCFVLGRLTPLQRRLGSFVGGQCECLKMLALNHAEERSRIVSNLLKHNPMPLWSAGCRECKSQG